jgi:hypothetical protein
MLCTTLRNVTPWPISTKAAVVADMLSRLSLPHTGHRPTSVRISENMEYRRNCWDQSSFALDNIDHFAPFHGFAGDKLARSLRVSPEALCPRGRQAPP